MTRRSNTNRSFAGHLAAAVAVIALSACNANPFAAVAPNLSVDGTPRAPIATDPQCEQYVSKVLTDLCWVTHGGDVAVIVDPITFATLCTCSYGDKP